MNSELWPPPLLAHVNSTINNFEREPVTLAGKTNGRTQVRPLGASLNEAHVFDFDFCFFFFVPITLLL
jgi:hypothetical protein